MQQRSLVGLQGGSGTQGVSTRSGTRDPGRFCSRTPGDWMGCCCRILRAPLWAWLLLAALVAPGARSFLSEEQEELLVELHNHYRGQVSPSASAMLPLKWDSSLKVIAENYAANCIWNHNPELEDTGENLFAGTGALDLRLAVEKWFLEHLDYDFDNNSCDEVKMCGHYTQMVWADTHRIGCAFNLCNNMEGLEWERVSFLVCNYYPAGNYEGERPYVEGDWCSRCPENLQKCENNLCVADVVVEEEEEEGEEEEEEAKEEEEEEEEEEVTTLPFIQTSRLTSVDANVLTVAPDNPPSAPTVTPDEDTPPSETDTPAHRSVTQRAQEEVREKTEEEKVDTRRETLEKEEETRRNTPPIIQRDPRFVVPAAAPTLISSVLLICVTAVLTVRL